MDEETPPEIGPAQIDAVAAFLPIFEQDGYEFGAWVMNAGQMPYVAESPEVDAFRQALSRANLLFVFDWVSWQDELARYQSDPAALAGADLLAIRKILTTHIRADRFVEGHFVSVLEDGHLLSVLRRLQAIRRELFGPE